MAKKFQRPVPIPIAKEPIVFIGSTDIRYKFSTFAEAGSRPITTTSTTTTSTTLEPTTTTTSTTTTTTEAPTTTTTSTTTSTTTLEPTTTSTTTTTTTEEPTTTTTTSSTTTTTEAPTTTTSTTTTTTTEEPTTTTSTTTTTTTEEPTTTTSTTTTTTTPTTTSTTTTTTTPTPTTTTTTTTTTTSTTTTTTTVAPTPSDPTLQIWYDASDPTVFNPSSANGTNITQWSDKSATAHNATPLAGSISVRPTVTTNFQNGKTVLYFDGGDGLGVNMSTTLQSLTGSTMIVVAKAISTGSAGQEQHFIEGARIQGSSYTPLDAYSLIISGSNGYNILFAGGKAVSNAAMDTNFHIHTIVFDGNGATNADKLKHRVDGVAKTLTYNVNIGTSTSATINAIAIGAQGDNTAHLTGYIGEILLYTKTLNATEINNTEIYLKGKWGIP